jgi:hypothetical protein
MQDTTMTLNSTFTNAARRAEDTRRRSAPSAERRALPRIPLIPHEVLKQHNAFCAIDTRFRSAARLLQCIWLKDQGIPTTKSKQGIEGRTYPGFASHLRADAAKAGRNFLNLQIHQVVLRELLVREEGASIDEERLFGNSLSSQPLSFNLFGNMTEDLTLATAVFKHLFPEFVLTVDQIVFEHSPGRREPRFLLDGTAFDVAIRVTTPEGEAASIFIETKYSEDMGGPAARMRDRYDEASRQVKLYRDPDSPALRSLALEQLWREHNLAQLAVDQGITSRAIFLAIGPRLNRRVMSAFRTFQTELIDVEHQDANRVAFEPMSLETFVDAIQAAGAVELAQALWSRYCDFQRIYDLSLHAIGGDTPASKFDADRAGDGMPLDGDTLPLGRRDRRILAKRTTQRARSPITTPGVTNEEIAS